jgi:hypothetical protein
LNVDLAIDGRSYDLEVIRNVTLGPEAPRLAVVSRQNNKTAMDLARVCIDAVRHFTPEPHELWVVDNNSPRENLQWLLARTDVNIALNRTEPLPPQGRDGANVSDNPDVQLTWASYANAIALEIAARLINPESKYLMSMHMDTMPCRTGWLSYLISRMNGAVKAAGVRMDKTREREGILHVLGYMVDFQLFQKLSLDYLPDLPGLDVGDRVTLRLREEGFDVFACPNTLWEPELAERIPASSPLKELHVDRSFDSDGNVIFLHLGRGVRKSIGVHQTGTMAEEWVKMAYQRLMV